IDEKRLTRPVVNRPTRATGNFDFGDPFPSPEVHDRYGIRIGNRGVAHVRGDQDPASGVERKPVRLNADSDLEGILLVTRREHRDGVLATVAREGETVQ